MEVKTHYDWQVSIWVPRIHGNAETWSTAVYWWLPNTDHCQDYSGFFWCSCWISSCISFLLKTGRYLELVFYHGNYWLQEAILISLIENCGQMLPKSCIGITQDIYTKLNLGFFNCLPFTSTFCKDAYMDLQPRITNVWSPRLARFVTWFLSNIF